MRKKIISSIFIGLIGCGLFAGGHTAPYTEYDQGWDDGWEPGFEEAQDDVCSEERDHIDEVFSDDSPYDIGWKKGYQKGYTHGYDKGCIKDASDWDEGWDAGYEPGFKEGKTDACTKKSYHIDEEFDNDGHYDKGWKKGYTEGYKKGWKSCDLSQEFMMRISVKFRDHGYGNLSSKVISSFKELERLLNMVDKQNTWNSKKNFINTLKSQKIDFKKYNLLLYRITETSGSISLNPQKPVEKDKHITVTIKREAPEIGTSDMAYYLLLYKVDKSIKDITFDNGNQEVIIENKESDMVIPKNCQAWYDGCNTCSRLDDGKEACTKRYCIIYRPQDFRCTKWK